MSDGSRFADLLHQIPDDEIWAVDSEWGFRDGRIGEPSARVPVLFNADSLHTQIIAPFWGEDPMLKVFMRERRHDLFVAHYAIAEITYLMRLHAEPPDRWFDTYIAERRETNAPGPPRASLVEALKRHQLSDFIPAEKVILREKILRLEVDVNKVDDRIQVGKYCLADCKACLALALKINDPQCDPHTLIGTQIFRKSSMAQVAK
jgi:hypothetical protein